MSRPGTRLRALSARVCSERLMQRLIDPAIADLQAEHEEAARSRHVWKSRWVLLSGYIAWTKVMALCGPLALRQDLSGWTVDDKRAFSRTIWVSLAATVAATVLLLRMMWTSWEDAHADTLTLVMYLIPAVLPLSVPAGLTLGTTLNLGGRTISRPLIIAFIMIGLGLSVGSFVMLDRIVPATNQAYREAVLGRTVERGSRELTLAELRARIEAPVRAGSSTVEATTDRTDYYARWALAGTPLVLTLFALAVVARQRFGRLGAGVAACLGIAGYVFLFALGMFLGLRSVVPPILAPWLPHFATIATSAALLRSRTVRLKPDTT